MRKIKQGKSPTSSPNIVHLVPSEDPALVASSRCQEALSLWDKESDQAEHTGDSRKADAAWVVYIKLCRRLAATPATSLRGVIAKIEEHFPDLDTAGNHGEVSEAALAAAVADLRRLCNAPPGGSPRLDKRETQ